MIVPQINTTADALDSAQASQELLQQIRHWSIFGGACLSFAAQTTLSEAQVTTLGRVVKQSSGFVDLQIDLPSLNDDSALELLNIGAASIVVAKGKRANFPSVPDERIVLDGRGDQTSSTQIWMESPAATQLVESQTQKADVCIDAQWLSENSETIVDYYCGVLRSDRPDGLWPTIICDSLGIALGLAYSNRESLLHAVKHRQGAYWSRSRGGLWVKGLTSGATQQLHAIRFDCDSDCLRFTVTQDPPGFCHRNTHTCFGEERSIATVIARLKERIDSPDEKSFTRKLATDAGMLEKKLLEEAGELAEANVGDDRYEVAWEAADVMYFALVAMLNNGVGLDEVYAELARRMNRIVRRKNKLES